MAFPTGVRHQTPLRSGIMPGVSRGQRAIGIDIGGTKIAGAVVEADGTVVAGLVERTPAESDAAAVTAVMLRMIERLRADHPEVAAVGVGAAGIVEWPVGRMLWAPNNAYRDWPVRGPNLPAGAKARVTGVDGTILLVDRVAA